MALSLVVMLEVGASAYFFYYLPPPTSDFDYNFITANGHTTTTTIRTSATTTGPVPRVQVQNIILVNDSLRIDLRNTGALLTRNVSVVAVCTPNFVSCLKYSTLAGRPLVKTFILPVGGEYWMNFTRICVVPLAGCARYLPIENGTYYLQLTIGFAKGKVLGFGVGIKANNTYSVTSGIQEVIPSLTINQQNLTGTFSVGLGVNVTRNHTAFVGKLLGRDAKGLYTAPLLTNRTGCGGSFVTPCEVGSINMISMNNTFSTVLTGISTPFYPEPYLLTVQDLTARSATYFATWIRSDSL